MDSTKRHWFVFWFALLTLNAIGVDFDDFYKKTCIEEGCHSEPPAKTIPTHPPFLEGHCLACHEDHRSTAPHLIKPGGDQLCLACHKELDLEGDDHRLVHPPGEKSCLDCHAPHQSRVRGLLRTTEDLKRCADCHGSFLTEAARLPYSHDYFDPETQCGNCHNVHRGSDRAYLRDDVEETCLTCHDLAIGLKQKTIANIARQLRTNPVVHGAMEMGSCPVCHTPHGSEQPSLLNAGYPAGDTAPYRTEDYALCWECHSDAMVEDATTSEATYFRNGSFNLHRLHVVELKHGRACHLCHEVHSSQMAHLMRDGFQFGNWTAPLKWEAEADGGRCQSPCHREKEYRRRLKDEG